MLLVLFSCLRPRRCYLLIIISPVINVFIDSNRVKLTMARLEDALVSPSGQGGEVLSFCNNLLNFVLGLALFSPMERSLFSFGMVKCRTSRKWKPGWAPPVRLISHVNFFSLD